MKRIWAILLVFMLAFSLVACNSNDDTSEPAPATTQAAGQTTTPEVFDVTVIIKATDSNYWQTVLLGAQAAAADSGGKIRVTTAGPASETDIDEQVTILENAIASNPAGIVIASISSDSTVPAVEDAISKGIPVVTVDNKLNTDKYIQHIATNHYDASAEAAEAMYKKWVDNGVDPTGMKVVAISADSGSAVNQARCEGFISKMKELVPSIVVLETQYCDNDIAKAQDALDNVLLANPELIGVFGDNNHMGNGIANSIEQNGKAGQIISFAFDSDDTEIEAIRNGVLTGIVVQDPYGMGYNGVLAAVASKEGESLQKDVTAATTLVTIENIDEPAVQSLLYPGK